jgi:hypothetical protein
MASPMLKPRTNSSKDEDSGRISISLYVLASPCIFAYTRTITCRWWAAVGTEDLSSSPTACLSRLAVLLPPSRPCLTSSSLNWTQRQTRLQVNRYGYYVELPAYSRRRSEPKQKHAEPAKVSSQMKQAGDEYSLFRAAKLGSAFRLL